MNISGESQPAERFRGAYLSANTFSLLRLAPILGRDFRPEDDRPGAPAVMLLGHGAWLRRYGGDPAVVGRTRQGQRQSHGHHRRDAARRALPVHRRGVATAVAGAGHPRGEARRADRRGGWTPQPNPPRSPVRRARSRRLRRDSRRTIGASHGKLRSRVKRLRDTRPEGMAGTLMTMMGAVVFVLLVACANLATLLLARSAHRSREVAIRASIGAPRWRIVRQLLIECVLLAAIAGVAGLALARIGVQQIAVGFDVYRTRGGTWIDADVLVRRIDGHARVRVRRLAVPVGEPGLRTAAVAARHACVAARRLEGQRSRGVDQPAGAALERRADGRATGADADPAERRGAALAQLPDAAARRSRRQFERHGHRAGGPAGGLQHGRPAPPILRSTRRAVVDRARSRKRHVRQRGPAGDYPECGMAALDRQRRTRDGTCRADRGDDLGRRENISRRSACPSFVDAA